MISEQLANVICKELKLQSFDFQDDTTADQVPGWDSLSHINIILAIEKEFAVKFKGIEILKAKNLGDLQRLVDSKLVK
ncbi:MAG: acyl carrier protein [Ignavibacteria bacterium]|jgi:acyl carrier protein|nr:acyl carrier protein [Ignavibacteria bacterium]